MGTFASRPDAFGDQEVALRPGPRRPRRRGDRPTPTSSSSCGRSRADVERRAEPERALREIGGRIIGLRHPEEVLQLSVDEAARLLGRGWRPDRRPRRGDRRPYWAYDATTGRPARPRPDRRHRRGEGRRGDLRQGRPRGEADLHRRLPERRPLRARLGPRRPRPALPDPVGRRGPADRRSRAARDADRLHRRAGRVRRGATPGSSRRSPARPRSR